MSIIWNANVHIIYDAILARTVPCYAQAQEFLEAQEKAEGDEQADCGHWSPVDRVQRTLKGVDAAGKACSYFETEVLDLRAVITYRPELGCPPERKTLTLAERMDFIRAYYRAATFATLGKDSISYELMSSWDMLDLGQMMDVIRFVLYRSNYHRQQELGVCFEIDHSKAWPVGLKGPVSWGYLDVFTTSLERVAYRHTSKADQGFKSDVNHFPCIVRGSDPEECRPTRGAHLADVYERMTRKERRLFLPRFKLPANKTTSYRMEK